MVWGGRGGTGNSAGEEFFCQVVGTSIKIKISMNCVQSVWIIVQEQWLVLVQEQWLQTKLLSSGGIDLWWGGIYWGDLCYSGEEGGGWANFWLVGGLPPVGKTLTKKTLLLKNCFNVLTYLLIFIWISNQQLLMFDMQQNALTFALLERLRKKTNN